MQMCCECELLLCCCRQADVVIEVRDARVPISSCNTAFEEIISRKKRVIVLNKVSPYCAAQRKKFDTGTALLRAGRIGEHTLSAAGPESAQDGESRTCDRNERDATAAQRAEGHPGSYFALCRAPSTIQERAAQIYGDRTPKRWEILRDQCHPVPKPEE